MPFPPWVFLAVLSLLPFFFMAALSHDRLVRRLYDSYREDWTKAGGPVGFFWRPSGPPSLTAGMAFVKSSMTWAFVLPVPLRSDPECVRHLLLFRVGLIVWNVGVITVIGLFFMGLRTR